MKPYKLGNLEEIVLLLVGTLYDQAYSVSVLNAYEKKTGKKINASAIHTVLYRLEDKGFLVSKMGDATAERGGKKKKLFYLTPYACKVLDELAQLREQLRHQIPTEALHWKLS